MHLQRATNDLQAEREARAFAAEIIAGWCSPLS